MAFGHQHARANFTPSSFVSPNFPLRILYPTNASQCPLSGYPLKLHGQPYVQLQLWMYSVSKSHFVAIDFSPVRPPRIRGSLFNVFSSARESRSERKGEFLSARPIPRAVADAVSPAVPDLLRRLTVPVAGAVGLLVSIAWYITWASSNLTMMPMAPSAVGATALPLFFALIVVMMVAMMLPSALPMALAYYGIPRLDNGRPTNPEEFARTVAFPVPHSDAWALLAAALR